LTLSLYYKKGVNMQKVSKERIICSVSGCSCEAEKDTNPPLCSRCQIHEKSASVRDKKSLGLKAAAEMSEQLWGHK
jgi:hypothetical protein